MNRRNPFLDFASGAYRWIIAVASWLQALFLLVFLFGPGPLSVDGLISLILKRREHRECGQTTAPATAS